MNSSHQIISYAVFCLKKKSGDHIYLASVSNPFSHTSIRTVIATPRTTLASTCLSASSYSQRRLRPPTSTLCPYTTLFRSNLIFELGLILLILLGWSFVAAEFAGGLLMIINRPPANSARLEEHTYELQSPDHLVCRLLLEKKIRRPHLLSECL